MPHYGALTPSLQLPRIQLNKGTDILYLKIVVKLLTRASTNIADALQNRGSRDSVLKALLYRMRRALSDGDQ